jgi:hypothetical protein
MTCDRNRPRPIQSKGNAPTRETTTVTFIDLEFDTIPNRGAPLGDIGSSLVSLHDLLRDLGTLAAYPSRVEFREIQVVAIEIRNPLKIKLSLLAIPAEAVKAFQEICRDIILFRERRPHYAASEREDLDAKRLANIKTALDLVLHADGKNDHITENEIHRLRGHIVALQNAEMPLKRVIVRAN